MLIAVCCDRGAPGSTTTALTLAAARQRPAVVVEADPYGGDLGIRLHSRGRALMPASGYGDPLPAKPSILGVAAGGPQDLWPIAHRLNLTVGVIPGYMAAEQGHRIGDWNRVAASMAASTAPVFADLGRIHVGSPSMPILQQADAIVPVCRGDVGSVLHLRERLEQLVPAVAQQLGRPPLVLPVVITTRTSGSQHATQVREELDATSAGAAIKGVRWLAWDPKGVHLLERGADPAEKPLVKTALMRSAQQVMELLGATLGLSHGPLSSSEEWLVSQDPRAAETIQGAPTRRSGRSRDGLGGGEAVSG